ncbi:MAG: TIGR00730 family Rossman fold protein [Chitinophagaceae bacterium]|nr:TIGR00730 family Rossman fold protein [Chitinophagaceae bacterium]
MSIKSLAVFCGSKAGKNPVYAEHAKQLGDMLAEKNITLVYGGGNKGIMGVVANAALLKKGKVIGVMPKALMEREHQHMGLTELHEVTDMHVRKAALYEKCDGAIILPGGYGTLDEFFEILTWNQLNIHDKKIFVINSGGFYDHLIEHLKKMEAEGFLYDTISDRMTIVNNPSELVL